MKRFLLSCFAVGTIGILNAWETPTMGWSSWNAFGHKINENIIKSQADAMVATGLKDAGYIYLNIDDGAFKGRDENGHLRIHPDRFPNGLKSVADYIKSKGMRPGTYSDAGYNTCASYFGGDVDGKGTGLCDHDQEDIDFLFKDCGFEFIKVDFCGGSPAHNENGTQLSEKERYTAISKAIANTGIPGLRMNVCRWAYPGTWVQDVATSWRVTEDIYLGWNSVKGIIGQSLYLSAYATEGHFNDLDMLEVGRGMSAEEDKTHFGMWCIMSSPLLIGCDVNTITDDCIALLSNPELIALNQDPLALQAYVVSRKDGHYVLVKDVEKLNSTTRAIAFYNPNEQTAEMSVDFFDINLAGKVKVRDLFERKDLGDFNGSFSATVPAHGTRIYRLEAENRLERNVYEAETGWITAYQELMNNQAVETGIYEENDIYSGGAKAGWLGKSADNDLQWRNVYSNEGGNYIMTISFISGEDRYICVEVNGELIAKPNGNSSGWNKIGTVEIPVKLNAGNNIVRLYNVDTWMPDIDCITLMREGDLSYYQNELDKALNELKAFDLSLLPEGISKSIADVIEQYSGNLDSKDAYIAATEKVRSSIESVKQALNAKAGFSKAYNQASAIVENSVKNDASISFASLLASLNDELNKCEQSSQIVEVESKLSAALKEYITNPDTQPMADKSWDVTVLITNPDFDVNTDGWSGGATWGEGVAEHWNRSFSTMQTLQGLKPGFYTVEVNALYRIAATNNGQSYINGTEKIPANIVANDDKVSVCSIYAHKASEVEGSPLVGDLNVKNGYVNSMYAASRAFDSGLYQNKLVTEVKDGKLKIGIECSTKQNDCWCCFDAFRLSYHGSEISKIENISYDTNEAYTIYNLNGICLIKDGTTNSISQLAPGFYIINGKVVYKK